MGTIIPIRPETAAAVDECLVLFTEAMDSLRRPLGVACEEGGIMKAIVLGAAWGACKGAAEAIRQLRFVIRS